MSAHLDSPGGAPTTTLELAHLEDLLSRKQLELAALEQHIADARSRLGSTESVQLLEANERLAIAALQAGLDAETASNALKELTRSADLDALTGLPNRTLLLDRLSQALGSVKRRQTRFALLFIDLNNFKHINDSLGHSVGDHVIKTAAGLLASCVRETDTVSRYGGDEFVILLSEIAHAEDAVRVAEEMVAALSAPTRVHDHVLRLTASVGISICPDDGLDADELIDRADAAMYRAKGESPGSSVFRGTGSGAQRLFPQPARASLRRPLSRHEIGMAVNGRRLAELQEANEHLVTAALDAQWLLAAAEEAQRKQRESLATLAHELRNPLTPIRNAVSVLGVGPSEPVLVKMQGIIERQVAHISRLVDDLLDVSRIETGKLRLNCSRLDIADVVSAALDAIRPAIDARQQTICVQLPTTPAIVSGDAVRLVQVFGNLLDNASKYTPNEGRIDLAVEVFGTEAVLTVSDTGIGISAEALSTIFEPFVQDAHAVGFHGGGLGIGLALVRKLVEAHGGMVRAESGGKGQGSRFVMTLGLIVEPSSATAGNSPGL